MLQALSKKGRFVTPALLPKSKLETIRRKSFYCPICKEKVVLRAGEYVTPHFSHYQAASCIRGKGESNYHLQGKMQLYEWLRRQHIPAQLEPHLQEINQWPDILLQINKHKIAIEFQCAKIDPKEIIKRNEGYDKLNIRPIWILGANRFKRIGKNKLKIDSFTLQMLQQYAPTLPTQLLYYCPNENSFLQASNLHMTNSHRAIAYFSFHKANTITFPDLFRIKYLPIKQLHHDWLQEKRTFRLSHSSKYGKEAVFRNWLYKQYLHMEQLPAIIYLPNPAQQSMSHPLWQWQARFVMEFLHPIAIDDSFRIQAVYNFLTPFTRISYPNILLTPHPAQIYIRQLQKLGILDIASNNTIIKRRPIRFHGHIEEAIRGDKAVLKKLMEEG